MSFQEKRAIVYFLVTLVVAWFYYTFLLQMDQASSTDLTTFLRFWGIAFLVLIPIQVVVSIIMYIFFSIINTIATKEEAPDITDEFDKLIELRATRNTFYMFGTGFLLAMAALVIKQPLSTMFHILLVSLFLAQLVGSASQIYFYRRGF